MPTAVEADPVSSLSAVLPKFVPGQAAAQVDQSLRRALAVLDRARECAILWFAEVARRSLFREFGHASLELYAVNGLGFSRNRYFQFKRLADDLERLPRLRAAVAAGRIGWTKAQQVARVATPASEAKWVEKAAATGRRDFAEAVKAARARSHAHRREDRQLDLPMVGEASEATDKRAGDPPTTVAFRLDGLQLAQLDALIERIRQRGVVPRRASREEILLAALQSLAESEPVESGASDQQVRGERPATPTGAGENQTCAASNPQRGSQEEIGQLRRRNCRPPAQVIVQHCPECGRTIAVTNHGDRELSPAAAEAVMCDAVIQQAGHRSHATVPPKVRAAVLRRDGHRCQAPGCGSPMFLHVHHIVPRSEGGSDRPENLITLCSRCHEFTHERGQTGDKRGSALWFSAQPAPRFHPRR